MKTGLAASRPNGYVIYHLYICHITAYSLATSIIILEQHRLALHRTRLVEIGSPYNPNFQSALITLSGHGAGATSANAASLARVSAMVTQQATFLASMDGFLFIVIVACVGGLIALLQRQIRQRPFSRRDRAAPAPACRRFRGRPLRGLCPRGSRMRWWRSPAGASDR